MKDAETKGYLQAIDDMIDRMVRVRDSMRAGKPKKHKRDPEPEPEKESDGLVLPTLKGRG